MAGTLVDYAKDIEAAREGVKTAEKAYSKGGSVNALNDANKALADAQQAYYRCQAGLARDDR